MMAMTRMMKRTARSPTRLRQDEEDEARNTRWTRATICKTTSTWYMHRACCLSPCCVAFGYGLLTWQSTYLVSKVFGGDKGYVYYLRGWDLLLTSTGESERLHGSEQTHKRPDPLTQEKTSGSYLRECSSGWSIPRQVVERTIDVIKRFAKLTHIHLYVRLGDNPANALVAIACHCANLAIGGNVCVRVSQSKPTQTKRTALLSLPLGDKKKLRHAIQGFVGLLGCLLKLLPHNAPSFSSILSQTPYPCEL
jgi:hypothetical protein